jgi:hypothetical protein
MGESVSQFTDSPVFHINPHALAGTTKHESRRAGKQICDSPTHPFTDSPVFHIEPAWSAIAVNPDPTSLERLHDIVAPPPAPWWPPAPAWYWVLGFFFGGVLVLLILALVRWQRNRYRREALAELARLEPALGEPATRAAALGALAELLKRAALTAFPREQVANLTGPDWFEFLDHTGRTTGFSEGGGVILERAVYDPRSAAALDEPRARELLSLVRHWLARHRVEAVIGGNG